MTEVLTPPTETTTRILLATIGVGVPNDDAVMLIAAVANEAQRIGYRHLLVENDQVSGALRGGRPRPTRETCPQCLRQIRRYPGGRFYTHRCEPVGKP